MKDKDSNVAESRRPPGRQRRLTSLLVVIACGLAVVVAAAPFLAVPVYVVLHDNFLGQSHPQYDGVSMHLADGEVVRLLAGGSAGDAKRFFVEIDGNSKTLGELTTDDLVHLGFRESKDRHGITYVRGPEGRPGLQSFADVRHGQFESLYLQHRDIRFSAHREGPFLELPVSLDRVKEVFGKPVKWNREKVQWY